jgi:hypothetical protein
LIEDSVKEAINYKEEGEEDDEEETQWKQNPYIKTTTEKSICLNIQPYQKSITDD